MKRVLIIGGGAGGMTSAIQIKKQNPDYEVAVFEKGKYVSWAGCPTPYYLSGELSYKSVIHHTPEYFNDERDIQVYTEHKVELIDFEKKEIKINGSEVEGWIDYDYLIMSTGAKSKELDIKSFDFNIEGLFKLNSATDAFKIEAYLKNSNVKNALILGSGFIGMEMAETFQKLELNVTVVEKMDTILPKLDEKLQKKIKEKYEEKEIDLITGKSVLEIITGDNRVYKVVLSDGTVIDTDIILATVGIKPNIELLKKSNFKFNEDERVYVDQNMETKYPGVYALGDMVYVDHLLKNEKVYAPFGDVANKQAVVVARSIAGKTATFKGVYGSFATSFYEYKIAGTGLSLSEARELNLDAERIIVKGFAKNPGFKGNKGGIIDVIYDKTDHIILGAFMIGDEAVAQFVDQFAIVIRSKIKIDELFDIDFCYSPTNSTVWNPLLATYRKLIK